MIILIQNNNSLRHRLFLSPQKMIFVSIFFFILLVTQLVVLNNAGFCFEYKPPLQRNSKYIVYRVNPNTIKFIDLENKTEHEETFNCTINKIDICPAHPFVSIIGRGKLNFRNYDETFSLIYDIELKKYYVVENILVGDFDRWSYDGSYAYINYIYSFELVKTDHLRDFLNLDSKDNISIKVETHPFAETYQVGWIGSNLIYAIGCCFQECWGYFSTSKMKNYFISCCTIDKDSPRCADYINNNEAVFDLFIEKIFSNGLIEVKDNIFEVVKKNKSK